MRKGDKWKKVFGALVILAIIVSVFDGVVSAEDVSEGLKQSVDDAKIQTAAGNLSSEELRKSFEWMRRTSPKFSYVVSAHIISTAPYLYDVR